MNQGKGSAQFDFGLWTRQIVAELIAQKCSVKLGVTAIGRLLYELDITDVCTDTTSFADRTVCRSRSYACRHVVRCD
jgi:hypothetical protein